ncbi:MAG: methyltransferase domain-containing protein [Desulfobacteraceae bacterium]|jgi:2-polyprenyl-3-methyl-5-hydroxy-6-metoxy-1,4-benzoquinol methylase
MVSTFKKQRNEFYHHLAHTIELSSNRRDFTVEFCHEKRVLHIGCVDAGIMDARIEEHNFLHYQIGSVAKKLIGADIEKQGLERLSSEGFEVYHLDLEKDVGLLNNLSKQVDVIVIPEVIEHLDNVGNALDNIKSCAFNGDILISTPNAFSFRSYKMIGKCVEMIHPDHNYYFSPTTLKTILMKHGFSIERLVMYYWKTNGPIGQELQKVVTANPYFAEGMIAVVKDRSLKGCDG